MNRSMVLMSAIMAAGVLTPASAQDATAGAKVFMRCSACHAAVAGKPSGIGPNLAGVVGRKAGTLPGYSFSPAMKGSNITWTADQLDAYLAKPQAVVKGNKMPFFGLPNAKDRADVVAYLKTLKK